MIGKEAEAGQDPDCLGAIKQAGGMTVRDAGIAAGLSGPGIGPFLLLGHLPS